MKIMRMLCVSFFVLALLSLFGFMGTVAYNSYCVRSGVYEISSLEQGPIMKVAAYLLLSIVWTSLIAGSLKQFINLKLDEDEECSH